MSGIISTFSTANKGLMAQQTALQTISHNISNANTEGFSRQRVDMAADISYSLGGIGQIGTGVKMEAIVRLVDEYVNDQIRQENGTLERFAAKSQVLEQLEIIFNEPSDTGVNFNLGEMFNAWSELAKNPESLNSKTIVVEKSRTLADIINHMANQIDSLKDDTIEQIGKNIYDFNSMVNQIKFLNKQIFNISVKDSVPNDLLDQRDLMLKNLSSIADFGVSFDRYGRASIFIGDKNIVEEDYEISIIKDIQKNDDGTYTLSISKGGDSISNIVNCVVDEIDDIKIGQAILNYKDEDFQDISDVVFEPSIGLGSITGNTEALNDIQERMSNLNMFAKTLAEAINIVHKYDNQELDFFIFEGSEDEEEFAKLLRVNSDILKDHSLVNAGKSPDSSEGDGSRALAIGRLRNTNLRFDNKFSEYLDYDSDTMTIKNQPGGITIEGAYVDIVTKVGISKEHADNMVANQEVLLNQLILRKESTSGVSINEEVTNLIKYQKAFEANAKVISVLSEMLDTLINRMGV